MAYISPDEEFETLQFLEWADQQMRLLSEMDLPIVEGLTAYEQDVEADRGDWQEQTYVDS